jgi:hypothetical protein
MECCSNQGASLGLAMPGCANFASKLTATSCAAKCSPTQFRLCTSDMECGAGKKCVPFTKAGTELGGCSL